jgi:Bacterial capsule synthesis protein PGA_cap
MVNLESSWQDSVIKLAQTGNLRAIAFWLNRYLVPQGICAQVTHEQQGCLLVRVVCHRPPERDRLVRFICHRLCKLNADGIQEARITAQIVGSPTLLWEKSARIVPTVHPIPVPRQPSQPSFLSRLHRTTQMTIQQTVRQVAAVGRSPVAVAAIPDTFLSSPQPRTHCPKPFPSLRDAVGDLDFDPAIRQTRRTIRRSLRWFLGFPPHVRILLLAGSFASLYLVGSAFNALHSYQSPTNFQSSEPATFGSRKFSLGHSNTVWTALENVPVIQQPVVNPQDSAVTLLFANSAALGRASTGQSGRLADMVITSLDQLPPIAAAVSTEPVPLVAPSALPTPPEAEALLGSDIAAEEGEAIKPVTPALPDMAIADLPANGVDIVNLASDGLLAGGTTDLAQAKDLLQKNAVHTLGIGQNKNEARRPVVVDVKGQRIAYLGYSDKTEHPTDQGAGINSVSEAQLAEDIKAVRDQVDWVVVTYQWSEEPKAYPEEWQVKMAHFAVDHGADLVVGNRPGMSQGGEVYQGRAIAYSLGSAMDSSPALKVTLQHKQMKLEFLPLHLGQPAPNGAEILQKIKQSSTLFDQPLESPTLLDGKPHLPTAPQSALPITDPFISYPTDQVPSEP